MGSINHKTKREKETYAGQGLDIGFEIFIIIEFDMGCQLDLVEVDDEVVFGVIKV